MISRKLKQSLGSLAYGIYGALWRSLHPSPSLPKEIKHVLVLNLLRIGDTVVTFPTMKALRELYPKAHITYVVRKMVSSLVAEEDFYDTLIAHDGDNSKESCRRLVPELPEADIAVVLDTSPWVSWAAREAKVKRVVAFNTLNRGFAATDRIQAPPMWNVAVPDYKAHWKVPYQGQAWYQLAEYLGAPSQEVVPEMNASDEALKKVDTWLEEKNMSGSFMLLHPVSSPSYLWVNERFNEVVQQLNIPVVVGGGPADGEICAAVAQGTQAQLYVGEGSLEEYVAMISRASHVLSVDTSAAHIAAAVRTPLTVLFGPGDPQIWGPRGPDVKVLLGHADCLGCKAAACRQRSHDCMESLTVSQVLEALPQNWLS